MDEDSLNQQQTLEKGTRDRDDDQIPPQTMEDDDDVYSEGDENNERRASAQLVVENDDNEHNMDDEADEYGEEVNEEEGDGLPVNSSAADLNQEELEAIIESITSGKS